MRFMQGRLGRKVVVFGAAMLVLAACSNSSTPTASKGAPKGTPMVGVTTIASVGQVLDNSKGFTLYHLTTESGGKIKCTGSCVSIWPPALASGSLPTAPSGVSGTFGTIVRPDGTTQLTFDGMPLYTYSGDTAAGQANGQGIQGVWFAVTTSGSTSGGGGSSSGGSGGGW